MNLLPEYNEIIYHARVCSEFEFREYWNEVQSSLSHPVTEMVTDADLKRAARIWDDGDGKWQDGFVTGANYVRDRITQPKSEWISMEDKLPEPYGFYLVYDPNKFKGYERLIARFDAYTQFWYDESDTIHPTHWMPLPQPPLKQKENE